MTRCHEGVAWWWHSPLAALHPQGFTDQRHGDVMVVRPMRDYTAKEIAFYNFFYSVPTVIVPPLFTKVGGSPGGEPTLCVPMAGTGAPSPVPVGSHSAGRSSASTSWSSASCWGCRRSSPPPSALCTGMGGLCGAAGGVGGLQCTHNPCFGCRTGEKLSPEPAKATSESQRCLLCLCGLDTIGGE